jgi:hypothetical protein
MDQQIDPMKVNINWEEFREKQREPAAEAVRGALALDEWRGGSRLRFPTRRSARKSNATPSGAVAAAVAVRANSRRRGIARLYSGLRREKTVEFLLSKATKIQAG